jgi:hypothetical protein
MRDTRRSQAPSIGLDRRFEQVVQLPRRLLLHRRQDMGVDIQGQADLGMAEALLDSLKTKP